ncbi:MAG TPA: MarP family serine protease [Candidatus Dormibacteraeota bacterium]
MDLLDGVIILLSLAALASGWRRGLTWVSLSLLGLAAGVVIGALVAPPLARSLAKSRPETQALIGIGIFLTAVALIQGVGTALGYQVRIAALRTRLASLDSYLGAGLAVLGTLAGAWYLGISFKDSPSQALNRQINDSAILRALDRAAPQPPAFLASIQKLFSGSSFPNPFANLAPEFLSPVPVPVPSELKTPGILQATQVVSRVLSKSECATEAGSAWPVARDYLVTNAHVVAGGRTVTVQTPAASGGQDIAATVVLFDPEVDVAILHVPGSALPPLQLSSEDPIRGAAGAVIGYPRGGPEETVPAAVRGTENAQGHDIYGQGLVTRRIEVLQATVIPGNSGGPVVDRTGVVIGLVFAASTLDNGEGYALTPSQIRADVTAGLGRTRAVSTQDCTS